MDKYNLLIVDDNPDNLRLLEGMLKRHGHIIRPVTSGKMALKTARISPPDMFLIDVNMPEMDGYELCTRLKNDETLKNIPVIFLTAASHEADVIRAYQAGAVDYIVKPYIAEELEAKVSTYLTLGRLMKDAANPAETFAGLVRQRRSVRDFLKDQPDAGLIMSILEAARWAPSGLNNQPWKFMRITDKEMREKLASFTKYTEIVTGAPVSIIACLDLARSYHRDKDLMAIGAAIQNILLCAHSLGLGTCWLGEIINRKDEIARWLGLDKDLEIMAVIAVGYPAGTRPDGERRPLEQIVIS